MELALLNLAIDCKLRSCDLLRLRVCDVSSSGIIMTRVLLTQSKTSRDVQFEITSKTQHALSQWLFVSQLSPQDF
ncbi:Phage integrase family protein [Vibrio vulnificus]|nr:Phage integrase family protein [Vibrio vulnificus]